MQLLQWANAVTSRADFGRWEKSMEYCAVAYNTCIARAHMWAIHQFASHNQWFRHAASELESIGPDEWILQALRCGECFTMREALNKCLDDKVRTLLAQMQIATQNVEGSAAERSAIRFRFAATRVWAGCAFVFF